MPETPSTATSTEDPGRTVAARGARVWIPAVLFVLAVIASVVVSLALGAVFLGAAIVAVVADVWIRLGMSSQDDRDEEARARRTFLRRGRWPTD